MNASVRDARSGDANAVAAIARESWHAAYDGILGAETVEETIDEWYAVGPLTDAIADAADRTDAVFLVGDRPSGEHERPAKGSTTAIAGFAHAAPDPERAGAAKLIRIYVRPSAWGRGLGSALLGRVEAECAAHFDALRLEVFAENDVGVSFYESTGFDRVETRESAVGDGVVECVYEKLL